MDVVAADTAAAELDCDVDEDETEAEPLRVDPKLVLTMLAYHERVFTPAITEGDASEVRGGRAASSFDDVSDASVEVLATLRKVRRRIPSGAATGRVVVRVCACNPQAGDDSQAERD